MFDVDANTFRLVHMFAGTDETRYYLHGVHVEPHHEKGVFLVATDGHRMLIAHDETGSIAEPLTVKFSSDALKLCKAGRGESKPRRVGAADRKSEAFIYSDNAKKVGVVSDWDLQGPFPEWRRAFKGADSAGGHDCFNAALMGTFAKVGKELTGSGVISLETSSKAGPALIRFANAPSFVGLLMPATWKFGKGYPAWIGFEPNPIEVTDEAIPE